MAYAEFDRIDILVNNAGMSPRIASHEVTERLFDSVVNLNFKGPFRLASQIAKRMMNGDERDHPSRWATVVSIADKIGCVP